MRYTPYEKSINQRLIKVNLDLNMSVGFEAIGSIPYLIEKVDC